MHATTSPTVTWGGFGIKGVDCRVEWDVTAEGKRRTWEIFVRAEAGKLQFSWGTEEGLGELLGEGVTSLQARRRSLVWRFLSARHHVGFMLEYYGPLNKAFGTLDEEQQKAFEGDLISLVESHNRSDDGTAIWSADYLEVVATRR